jgi:hypothetical protein
VLAVRKMALASDLKDIASYKPLEFLKEWARTFRCKLDIINIVEQHKVKPEVVPASISLENLLSEFHPQFYFIEKENVEEGVYEYAEENHPDILVIVLRQHGLVKGLFHKSQSKPFILHPHIPVLAVGE